MDLKNLSDQMLHEQNLRLVREEREILTKILYHLLETDKRRLFSHFKLPSLFEYAVQVLKYSSAQAQRRISAMRLLRDLPDLEEKIENGDLSLSHLNLAQTLFSSEKKAGRTYSVEMKSQILSEMENKTTRQAEKIIYAGAPQMKPESLTFNNIEDDVLREKLLRVKGKYAHSHPDMTLNELLHMLCDRELSAPKTTKLEPQVWERDGSKCTVCSSTYAIEIDHRIPRAKGGASTLENLRLLCRKCNQRAATRAFWAPEDGAAFTVSGEGLWLIDGRFCYSSDRFVSRLLATSRTVA